MPALRSLALPIAVAASMLGLLTACSERPTSFPDRDGVIAAQAEWCAALAKLQRAGASWEHMNACKAAYPTSSPTYLRAMTSCFSRRMEAATESSPDRSQIILECNDEVAVNINPDDPVAAPVLESRCARMLRCERVPIPTCKATYGKLESAQRAMFSTIYNATGRYEIMDCFDNASCTDNEEAGRQACYKPTSDALLWFPD
ncbi:MAG TPA: hypothetical protein VL242_10250 [Sorangium sp.]|uniref:hypothetical protein n=1 Tax=unclassified Sorangium TaxID=2621164 RepID=UPI002BFF0BBC|nr:hypothetical protein [Sorangium sp.]